MKRVITDDYRSEKNHAGGSRAWCVDIKQTCQTTTKKCDGLSL